MASLIVVNGPKQEKYFPLGHRPNIVGRDEALPIQVLDPKVSRKHLKIQYEEAKDIYVAIDMKSRHGVVVNGVKVSGEVELADNTYIQIGDTMLFFTTKDFEDRENALGHYKKVGERFKPTFDD